MDLVKKSTKDTRKYLLEIFWRHENIPPHVYPCNGSLLFGASMADEHQAAHGFVHSTKRWYWFNGQDVVPPTGLFNQETRHGACQSTLHLVVVVVVIVWQLKCCSAGLDRCDGSDLICSRFLWFRPWLILADPAGMRRALWKVFSEWTQGVERR